MRRTNHQNPNTVTMAGWLLADLLLGLAMLFFVLNTKGTYNPKTLATITPTLTPVPSLLKIEQSLTPTPTFTRTPMPPATITPTIGPTESIGMDLVPLKFTIHINDTKGFLNPNGPSDLSVQSFLKDVERIFPTEYRNRRAALIITLGYHPEVIPGRNLATIGNRLLINNYPEIFTGVISKSFWWNNDINNPPGDILFEIYFFTRVIQ